MSGFGGGMGGHHEDIEDFAFVWVHFFLCQLFQFVFEHTQKRVVFYDCKIICVFHLLSDIYNACS